MADLRDEAGFEAATERVPTTAAEAVGRGAAGGFAADDGSVPAEVADVLGRRATGAATVREVVTCLSGHRLLIPLLEVDADQLGGDDTDPCAGSDRAMAAVSVLESDGMPLGLAFTGMPPMLRWDARARPLPVEATRAAGAVLAGGGRAMLVDAGSPETCRIEGVALARLGSAEAWPDPWEDPAVRAAIVGELGPVLASGELQVRLCPAVPEPAVPEPAAAGSNAAEPGVRAPSAPEAGPGGLMLELRFRAGVSAEVAQARAAEVARRMSVSASLREVYDGVLAVRLVP